MVETLPGTTEGSALRQVLVRSVRYAIERKRAELALARRQALHDPLTDLPNRTMLTDRLELALGRLAGHPGSLAVLLLDLDRFKLINDSFGHEAGDRLLVEVAARLSDATRAGDSVARFGSDEFAILCEDVSGHRDALRVAEHVNRALMPPFEIEGHEVFVTASVGIAIAEDHSRPAVAVIRDADVAARRAKEGGAATQLFDQGMRTSVIERLDLESALHWAVERDELELHWQPIVELESGALSGVEALLRWRHPQLGLLAPLDFIPLAEELGLIVPIGAWVLGQACAEHARWASARGDEAAALTVSVNLSPRQLSRDFAREVAEALSASGTDPANVMLEITESIFLRNDRETKAVLESLNGIGVRLAVDDFGVGYSSLHTLKQVTASALKIDRSFIAQMHHQVDQAIVRAILGLSEELGLETIAEGVETKGQLDMLRRFGCRAAQGFLFSEPRPTAALEQSFGPGLLVPAS